MASPANYFPCPLFYLISNGVRSSRVRPPHTRFLSSLPARRDAAQSRNRLLRRRAQHDDLSTPTVLRSSCTKRRGFSTTQSRLRDHHFDTLKFVQRLKDEGFSEEQSKAMMLVLSDVIEESIQNLTRTMVLREGYSSLVSLT